MERNPQHPPPRAPPEATVVISTYNRCDLLPGAIAGVLAQRAPSPSFELVVVDNNSTDGTRDVVEALRPDAGGRLRYAFEPAQGIAHARNAGIALARGRYVAFTDDDVRVSPDWLATVVRAFEEHPDADFVGGRVLPRWPGEPPRWLTSAHWPPLAITDYGDEPFYVDLRRPACLIGANVAFRRAVFDEFGLFDPRFQHEPGAVSAGEDHELELRLWRAGRRGYYEPAIRVTAEVQPSRLEKRHHRRWHHDHGRMLARLTRDDEIHDGDGALVAAPGGVLRLFGAPAWAYRQTAGHLAAALGALARGERGEALRHECAAWEGMGFIRDRVARHRTEAGASRLAELWTFARALLGRRHARAGGSDGGGLGPAG